MRIALPLWGISIFWIEIYGCSMFQKHLLFNYRLVYQERSSKRSNRNPRFPSQLLYLLSLCGPASWPIIFSFFLNAPNSPNVRVSSIPFPYLFPFWLLPKQKISDTPTIFPFKFLVNNKGLQLHPGLWFFCKQVSRRSAETSERGWPLGVAASKIV